MPNHFGFHGDADNPHTYDSSGTCTRCGLPMSRAQRRANDPTSDDVKLIPMPERDAADLAAFRALAEEAKADETPWIRQNYYRNKLAALAPSSRQVQP